MGYGTQNISVAGPVREFLECKYGPVRVGNPGIDGVLDRTFLDRRPHPWTDSRHPGRRPSYFGSASQESAPAGEVQPKATEALDLIARALRAGHSVSAALEIVAEEGGEPLRSEFREVYKQQNFGIPQRDALQQLGRRVPSADLQIVITAMLVQKETGGNLVEILERTTAVLRDRMRIQGELRVRTAQGRLTGWILCLLPVVMFVLISLANPGYTDVLVHDPVGRKLTYTGIGMMAMGALTIRKIVRIKV